MDRKIVEMLISGVGVNQIAKNVHVSKRRIRALREQAKERRYLEEDGTRGPVSLPQYPEALFPDPPDGRALRLSEYHQLLEPHREWIRDRMETGWHAVTVFEELPVEGVSRSSFYRYLEREGLNRLGETYRVVPEIRHKPGEAILLDWGKLRDVIDPVSGRKQTLWMFVGVLGYSRYRMLRLVWTMDTLTTLRAIESMLREIGGVPFKITIDNPKCVALEASLYEPMLNPAMERFASHYGILIECLPPADPEKKGKVERPMPYCRRLYEAHGDPWKGIEESQSYLDRKLQIANDRPHGTTLRRPKEVLLQEEAKALKPLPPLNYEVEQFHEGVVRQDGHVRFGNKYYSLEEKYKGKKVIVLGDSKLVSIYFQGKLLEVHDRITDPSLSKSTKPQHLKPWERAMQDGSLYRKKGAALGPHVEEMIVALLSQGQGFIDTRKIWGILSLDKRYPPSQIDTACSRALEIGKLGYQVVKSFLEWDELKTLQKNHQVQPVVPAVMSAPKHVRPLSVYREKLSLYTPEEGPVENGSEKKVGDPIPLKP